MGLRDDILGADDLAFRDVVVPEWKGRTVRVLEMDCETRIAYEDEVESAREANGGKAESVYRTSCRLLIRTLRDPATGVPIFGGADLDTLARRSTKVLLRLGIVSAEVSKVGAEEVGKEAGKSNGAPSASSPTT